MSAARVAALFRYPVKSMAGAPLPRVDVGPGGVPGDRGWALRVTATGQIASAKRFAALMLCRAKFVDEPVAGAPPPPAEVELPDGTRARTDDLGANALLSRLLGAEVTFVRAADGAGHFDARPIHVLTTAALVTMRAKTGLDFDFRRFRPNVLVGLDAPGRPEDAWLGRTLRAGTLGLRVLEPVKRCVMTTLPQPGVAAAPDILRAVVADGGALGVYAQALAQGACEVGDAVDVDGAAPAAGAPAPAAARRRFKIKSWIDGRVIFEGEHDSLRQAVEAAVGGGVDLSFANLWGTELAGARLAGANLREANFAGANLEGADLSGAHLWKANLAGANLVKANLSNANLEDANVSTADVSEANLWGANLAGVDIKTTKGY